MSIALIACCFELTLVFCALNDFFGVQGNFCEVGTSEGAREFCADWPLVPMTLEVVDLVLLALALVLHSVSVHRLNFHRATLSH